MQKKILLFLSLCLCIGIQAEQRMSGGTSEPKENLYIHFNKHLTNIISRLALLDNDTQSPVHILNKLLDEDYLFYRRDEIYNVLHYAEWLLQQQPHNIQEEMVIDFNKVVDQVLNGDLDITEDEILHRHDLPLVTIDKRIKVKGKALFKSDVIIEKKLRVHGKARFYEDVKFKDEVVFENEVTFKDGVAFENEVTFKDGVAFENEVTFKEEVVFENEVTFKDGISFDGPLSISDLVVDCDLTVGCNISMVDSVDSGHGNIIKSGDRFIHNFGTDNTFVGKNAGNFNVFNTGIENVGIGVNALLTNTTGSDNTAVGYQALMSNVFGSDNVAVGANALANNNGGIQNVAVGSGALETSTLAVDNTAVGYQALTANTVGINNTAVGSIALQSNTGGNNNVAVGTSALSSNTAGVNNTAVGYQSLTANTAGVRNTAVGASALAANTTGQRNVAIGYNALLVNTSGEQNIAVGDQALLANTTGFFNIAVGTGAMSTCTEGFGNVAIGTNALEFNLTGSFNVAVGHFAGVFSGGSNNVFIQGGNAVVGGDNNIIIGTNGDASDVAITRIGTPGIQKCFIGGISGVTTDINDAVTVVVDSAGQLGTMSSSRRFKHSIQRMADESCAILQLEPVSFVYNSDKNEMRRFGLIAEEVDEVFPRLVVRDKDGEPVTVRYEVLPVLLLNEMKKLVARVEALEKMATTH